MIVVCNTDRYAETQDIDPPTDNVNADTNNDEPNEDDDYGVQDTSSKAPNKPRKKRTRKIAKNQPSLDSFARRPALPSNEANNDAEASEPTLVEDLNLDRRKRRKTTPPKPAATSTTAGESARDPPPDLFEQLQTEAGLIGTQEVIDQVMVDTLVINTPKGDAMKSSPPVEADAVEETVPESSLPHAAHIQSRSVTPPNASEDITQAIDGDDVQRDTETPIAQVTPKKQIKITKSGKLVSSPPKKPDPPISTTPKRRGRPRKAAKTKNLSSTITVIRYGSDKPSRLALGEKIDAILNGGNRVEKHVSILAPKPAGPPKPAHPFFTGKAGQKTTENHTQPEADPRLAAPKKSACTPGKLRAERRKEQGDDDDDMPAFGTSYRSNQSAKQSGLHEPSWPSKETAHVRNLDSGLAAAEHLPRATVSSLTLRPAKLKHTVHTLSVEEELIMRLTQELSNDPKTRPGAGDQTSTLCEDVRLPARLLTTGVDIQNKVRANIRAPIESLAQRLYAKTHPAITTLFDDIEHTLTPFDEGRCETQAWAQKYRPVRADHVLQPGGEAGTLKDWLKSLTVMAVGAAQNPAKGAAPTDAKRPAKKKRKTAADDFIVFSDEEDEDEDEKMVEVDPNFNPASRHSPSLKLPRWTRNKNVVLMSGPHGCGKSATVYAVAKELDFEVFELHSGVRRSGKDIQDKVGDMTANHLVNHQRGDIPAKAKPAVAVADNDTDNERDNAFQKDLDSGRQGTMTSFFTAKPSKPKLKPKPKARLVVKSPAKTRTIPAAQAMLPIAGASRKSQKQSLILIEEADILFDEDQNFWAQIIKLASQSKRPIVITCNDELHIPTQALPMAAVLRLTPPPVDLATDYIVAMTGREGHIIQRQAISDLYVSKNHDLRASITELNFWCQMSVGDKKGGLEWMYQRWPPGQDVDANGRLLRVASKDTYQSGMGWLSHNVSESQSNAVFDKEAELLTGVWHDWNISPTDLCALHELGDITTDCKPTNQTSKLDELDRLVSFSDALSAADIYSRIDLPSYENMHDQPMDPTLPPINPKERLSYTIDRPVLQVDPRTDYLNTDTSLATTTHILATRAFPELSAHRQPALPRSSNLENAYTSLILNQTTNPPPEPLQRSTFSAALDILATPPSAFNTYPTDTIDHRTSYNLLASSLDRAFPLVTLDIAPYVRSIVAREQVLESQRIRLGNLLSEGGRAKRGRTTKASRTAMEGGERAAKRRERWFHRDLSFEMVMRTAGERWAGLGWKREGEEGDGSVTASLTGTQVSESGGEMQMSGKNTGGQEGDVEMVVDAEAS
jgi:DNA polymerase III delta prime subunit